ncbi:MAG: amidohydrolase, partial [Frankiales bacterium]|nr:amidohydrolase [Frankiales bacterium]
MSELLRRPTSLLLHDVEVEGARTSVLVRAGRVVAVSPGMAPSGVDAVDGRGGALLPGLNDHHVHLLATAAAATSVDCGPPAVRDRRQLARALAGGVRGVG